jgi:hypothetical protein
MRAFWAQFGNPGFSVRLATTPGLSQLATATNATLQKDITATNDLLLNLASPHII